MKSLLGKELGALHFQGVTLLLITMEEGVKMAQKKRENPLTVRISEKTRDDIKQAAQAQSISPNKFAANALQTAIRAAQQKQ
jgi:predicted HicB family RNase H-like nuclease